MKMSALGFVYHLKRCFIVKFSHTSLVHTFAMLLHIMANYSVLFNHCIGFSSRSSWNSTVKLSHWDVIYKENIIITIIRRIWVFSLYVKQIVCLKGIFVLDGLNIYFIACKILAYTFFVTKKYWSLWSVVCLSIFT